MGIVRRTIGSLSPRYVIRAYVIALALFAFVVWFSAQPAPGAQNVAATGGYDASDYPVLAFFFVGSLLFPFTKLVWDELRDLALGRSWSCLYLSDLVNCITLKAHRSFAVNNDNTDCRRERRQR